jgi:predicted nucleotidyltransferase component of viral defense system
MHEETIAPQTKSVLDKISGKDFQKQFYLAGGTALALHLGHRISVDLDFFTAEKFSVSHIKEELSKLGNFEVTSEDADGTLNGILDGVSVSFFKYSYKNIYPTVPFGGIFLADEKDISAMKIDAVASRGSRKDFTDIYFLLQKYHLSELINFFETRYKTIHYNKLHILKSLCYFENAENDPFPIMLKNVSWEEIKRTITNEAKKIIT